MRQTRELESDACHVDVRGNQICSLECLSNSSAWGASLSECVNSLSLHRGTPSTASIAAERECSAFLSLEFWSRRALLLPGWNGNVLLRDSHRWPRSLLTYLLSLIPTKKKVRVTKERRRSSGWLLCKVTWYKESCHFCYFLENNPRIQATVDMK